jgi:hypothetical protein
MHIEVPEENSIVAQTDFSAIGKRRQKEYEGELLDKKHEVETHAYERWEKLISIFGTQEARSRFIGLCKQYQEEYWKSAQGQHEHSGRKSSSAPDSKRAAVHNEIMSTIQRLSLAVGLKRDVKELLNWAMDRHNIEDLLKTIHIV